MRSAEILIIGGGAAGMAASIEAARAGKKVLLIEKKKSLGKKLLATGNGRCNFTNQIQEKRCYHGEQASLAFQAVTRFGCSETLAWFSEMGILPAERQGYYYPASFQAASVLHILERELKMLDVEVHTEETVLSVRDSKKGSFFVDSDKSSYVAKKLLICTGGKASPVHGSSGDGYLFAKSLGHSLVQPLPALTSLMLDGTFMKEWAGNRLHGKVWLSDETGKKLAEDSGEIQLVDYGISGIPVFQISRFAAKALSEKHTVFFHMDSMPVLSEDELFLEFLRRKEKALHRKKENRYSTGDLLEGMFPDKFLRTILKLSSLSIKAPVEHLEEPELHLLVKHIKEFRTKVKAVSGFEKAQVCAGGIPLEEIEIDTFASKKTEGLYLAGEVLDVDGSCGGYNLQWAWTSGITAGKAMGN